MFAAPLGSTRVFSRPDGVYLDRKGIRWCRSSVQVARIEIMKSVETEWRTLFRK